MFWDSRSLDQSTDHAGLQGRWHPSHPCGMDWLGGRAGPGGKTTVFPGFDIISGI